jgi:hypothetical protein
MDGNMNPIPSFIETLIEQKRNKSYSPMINMISFPIGTKLIFEAAMHHFYISKLVEHKDLSGGERWYVWKSRLTFNAEWNTYDL